MSRRVLVVTAVEQEAAACRAMQQSVVVVGGIGRTNAAVATTRSLLEQGPFDAVLSMGIAGALPNSGLAIGDVVVGTSANYAEEGIITPDGFQDMTGLGFPLGDFTGNMIPADPQLLECLQGIGSCGAIATVATVSGTDEAAQMIQHRTGAIAEGMEGAAVLHAALLGGVPAIEIRAISNTTGDRNTQKWDFDRALAVLAEAAKQASDLL